jgi:hypothetical protein
VDEDLGGLLIGISGIAACGFAHDPLAVLQRQPAKQQAEIGGPQYAPSRRIKTMMVLARMKISSQGDQLAM